MIWAAFMRDATAGTRSGPLQGRRELKTAP